MTAPDALDLLRSIHAALTTREGRAIAREIVLELRLADADAHAVDPVAADVDEAFNRARRADRRRTSGRAR